MDPAFNLVNEACSDEIRARSRLSRIRHFDDGPYCNVPPPVHEVVTGAIVLVIAIVDAPDLIRELTLWRFWRAERRADKAAAQPTQVHAVEGSLPNIKIGLLNGRAKD
jgi:hypothetical protein